MGTTFTADVPTARAALAALAATGGGDAPESACSGIEAAIGLDWRAGVKKAIVVMGDAPPHDPEPTTGYAAASVAADAIALDPAEIFPVVVGGSTFGWLSSSGV